MSAMVEQGTSTFDLQQANSKSVPEDDIDEERRHWKSPVMQLDVTNSGRLVGRHSGKTLTKKATERDLAKGNAWGSQVL